MKTTHNTVLITGGSAGIGFEIARSLSKAGNRVIITGRDSQRLAKAAAQLSNVTAIACDVSLEDDINQLVARMETEFPSLNMLINNAGKASAYQLGEGANAYEKAGEEMLTNYLSVIRLTEKLLPMLGKQPESAIVNVSSIVAFAPGLRTPTYSASKAALHSYTRILRYTLAQSSTVKVFELMPPLVNTDFSQPIGGSNGIPPSVVAADLMKALEADQYEIHVGVTEQIYQLYLNSPDNALAALNAGK